MNQKLKDVKVENVNKKTKHIGENCGLWRNKIDGKK